MRLLLTLLAVALAPTALAQSDWAGTWTAVGARTIASEGDTTQAPTAYVLVLHAESDALGGVERRSILIPDGAWGSGTGGGVMAFDYTIDGTLVEGGVAEVSAADVRGSGRTLRYRLMLTHDGERLALTPVAGPHHDPLVYRRAPVLGASL